MNKNQVNKVNMVDSTLNYLDEKVSVWQSIAKIAVAKTELSQVYEFIESSAEMQEATKATIGRTKIALKRSIATKADILNDVVEAFANFEGNDELARKMSDSKSALLKLPYDELILRVKMIIEQALANKGKLVAEYGMTEAQVTDLQNDVNRLLEISDQPRAYQIKRGVATQEIDQLLAKADDLLNNQLDKLISIFKNRDVNFYNGYQKARMIMDH